MIKFIIAAALTTVVALLILLRPYIWKVKSSRGQRQRQNASIYREELAKLEQDKAQQLIDESTYQQTLNEIQQRVLQETQADEAVTFAKSPKKTIILICVLVPMIAVGIYTQIGSPEDIDGTAGQEHATQKDIEIMVNGLAAKLETEPNNYKGWAMLARSYKALKRPVDAQKAFERAGSYLDTDAQGLADFADVVATNANGDFSGKPTQLIEQALKVEPENVMALWLAGTAAYNRGDFVKSVSYWEHLQRLLPANSDDAHSIEASLKEARVKANLPPVSEKMPAALTTQAAMLGNANSNANTNTNTATTVTANTGASSAATSLGVAGVVSLDKSLRDKLKPEAVLLIIARPVGVRMPVAVFKTKISDQATNFTLDDSMSMSPDARISQQTQVTVEARISQSGNVMPESGDLISDVTTAKLGATDIRLTINKIRP